MLDFFQSNDPAKIVEKSNKLRVEGKFDKAEQLLKKHVKNTKDDYLILLELGRAQFDQGKLSDAMVAVRGAYLANPDELSKITDIVEDMHYRASEKVQTGALLLELYTKKRDLDNFHKIIQTLSIEEAAGVTSIYDKTFKTIKENKTLDQLNKRDVEIYIILGFLYVNSKKFREAKQILEIIFKTQTKERDYILSEYQYQTKNTYGNPGPHMAIGDLYLIINDKDKAINYFQKAVSIDPNLKETVAKKFEETITDRSDISHSSKLSLVDLYVNKNDFDKAVEILHEVIDESPENMDDIKRRVYQIIQTKTDFIPGYKLLCKILKMKGDVEGLLANLEKIFEMSPSEADFLISVIEDALEKGIKTEDLLVLKSKILISTGGYQKAAKSIRKIYDKNKDYAFELEVILNELLAKDSSNFDALSVLSEIFVDKGHADKARQLLGYISSIDEEQFNALAVERLSSLLDKFPDDLDIKQMLSLGMIKGGKLDEAKNLIVSTIQAKPDSFYEIIPNLYESANSDAGIAKSILNIIEKLDSSKYDRFLFNYSYAEMAYLAGDLDKSLKISFELLRSNPDRAQDVEALLLRLKAKYPEDPKISEFEFNYYLKEEDYDKALEAALVMAEHKEHMGFILDNLYLLIKHKPKDRRIINNIVRILDEMGLYEKIIQDSESFLNTVPLEESGLIRFYLGKAYAQKGQISNAATLVFQAITLDESIIEKAVEILNNLLKIDFSSMKVHYALAQAYYRMKEIDKAVDELMEISAMDASQIDFVIKDIENYYEFTKRNPKLTFAMGKLYMQKGNYEQALIKFKETYEMDQTYIDSVLNLLKNYHENEAENGEILFTMGVLYAHKGLFKIASDFLYNAMTIETTLKEAVIIQLQSIIAKQPEEIDARFSLAQVYKDMHNFVQAISLLRQIEMINPGEMPSVVNYYLDMLSVDPSNTMLLLSIADTYLRMGEIDKSLDSYKKVLSIDKNHIDSIIDRLQDYEHKNTGIQMFLSDLYKENGDYINAVNWLNAIYITDITTHELISKKILEILNLQPRQQNALMLLSFIYFDLKEYQKLIDLSYDVFEKSTVEEIKFRLGILISQAYKKLDMKEKSDAIVSKMKGENLQLFYTIVTQIYEQEKSKKLLKFQLDFEADQTDEKARLNYADFLVKQRDLENAKKVLNYKFKAGENADERMYLLSRISEETNNIIFALEIASPLRSSQNPKHISHIINLMKKLGYYGEIDSLIKGRPETVSQMNSFRYVQNAFNEFKIIA